MRKVLSLALFLSLGIFPILAFVPTPALAACEGSPTAPLQLKKLPGEKTGQVYLWWLPASNVDHYNILIGNKSNTYTMGGSNIGDSNATDYSVNFLDTRRKYFFRVVAVCGDQETWSNEVYSYPRKRPF